MSLTADPQSLRLAGNIASRVAQYENAWRQDDSQGMREHLQALDRLCDRNPEAELLRAACTITAACTRDIDSSTRRQRDTSRLEDARYRDELIGDYVAGTVQQTMRAEFAIAA